MTGSKHNPEYTPAVHRDAEPFHRAPGIDATDVEQDMAAKRTARGKDAPRAKDRNYSDVSDGKRNTVPMGYSSVEIVVKDGD